MVSVVGVRFKKAGKIYYFGPGEFEIETGQHVIVETARGVEFGEVVVGPKTVTEEEVVPPLKTILRLAEPTDLDTIRDNQELASQAFIVGTEKVQLHNLDMKLVDVEYTFDHGKLIFYFTADGRVDFRDLVKDLASVFRTRIELRQIGVRDEAKMIGGIGPCGRPLCCATFLGEFDPVSIRMAKEQNLSLNPGKISGICGRLMCCLRYESNVYREQRREMPDKGAKVMTSEHGEAQVKGVEPLKGTLKVKLEESAQIVTVDADSVEELKRDDTRRPKKPRAAKPEKGKKTEDRKSKDMSGKPPRTGEQPANGKDHPKKPPAPKRDTPANAQEDGKTPDKPNKERRRRPKRRRTARRQEDKSANQNDNPSKNPTQEG